MAYQKKSEPEVLAPESDQPNSEVGTLLKQGLQMVRLENETQISMAVQRPRNEEKLFDGALSELCLSPEFAKRAYYSIPYKDYSGGEERTVMVEGLSIKAAMALARRWGNCSNGARIVEDQEDRVTVEGVFLDYETNMRTLRTLSVAKRTWSKKTKTFNFLRPDRLNMAIQAGMSKAVRNAILNSLPVGLLDLYFAKAKELSLEKKPSGKVDLVATWKGLKDEFQEYGVTEADMKTILGKSKGIGPDDMAQLRGTLTALQDGQITVEALMQKPAAKGKPEQGAMDLGDILPSEGREPGQD